MSLSAAGANFAEFSVNNELLATERQAGAGRLHKKSKQGNANEDKKMNKEDDGILEKEHHIHEIRTLQYNVDLFPDFIHHTFPRATRRTDWVFDVLFRNLRDDFDKHCKKAGNCHGHFLDFYLYQEMWTFSWAGEHSNVFRNRHVDTPEDDDTEVRCSPLYAGQMHNPTGMNSGLMTCYDHRRLRLLNATEAGVDAVTAADVMAEDEHFYRLSGDGGGTPDTFRSYSPPLKDWMFWLVVALGGAAVAYSCCGSTYVRTAKSPGAKLGALLLFFAAGAVGAGLVMVAFFNAVAYTYGAGFFFILDACVLGLPGAVLAFLRDGSYGRFLGSVIAHLVLLPVVVALSAIFLRSRQRTQDEENKAAPAAPLANWRILGLVFAFYVALSGLALLLGGVSSRYDWWGRSEAVPPTGNVDTGHAGTWIFRQFSQATDYSRMAAKGVLAGVFDRRIKQSDPKAAHAVEYIVVFNFHTQHSVTTSALRDRQLDEEDPVLRSHEANSFRVMVNQLHETALFVHEVVEAVVRKQADRQDAENRPSTNVHVILGGDTNFHRVNAHFAQEVANIFGDGVDEATSRPFGFQDGGDALRLLTGMDRALYDANKAEDEEPRIKKPQTVQSEDEEGERPKGKANETQKEKPAKDKVLPNGYTQKEWGMFQAMKRKAYAEKKKKPFLKDHAEQDKEREDDHVEDPSTSKSTSYLSLSSSNATSNSTPGPAPPARTSPTSLSLSQQIFGPEHPTFQPECVRKLDLEDFDDYDEGDPIPLNTPEDAKNFFNEKHGYAEGGCVGTGIAHMGWEYGGVSGAFGQEIHGELNMADVDQVATFPWPQFHVEGGDNDNAAVTRREPTTFYRTIRSNVPWHAMVVPESGAGPGSKPGNLAVMSDHFPVLSTALPRPALAPPRQSALPETSEERRKRLRENVRNTRVDKDDLSEAMSIGIIHLSLRLAGFGFLLLALAACFFWCLLPRGQTAAPADSAKVAEEQPDDDDNVEDTAPGEGKADVQKDELGEPRRSTSIARTSVRRASSTRAEQTSASIMGAYATSAVVDSDTEAQKGIRSKLDEELTPGEESGMEGEGPTSRLASTTQEMPGERVDTDDGRTVSLNDVGERPPPLSSVEQEPLSGPPEQPPGPDEESDIVYSDVDDEVQDLIS
eukprot:g1733.t1